MERKIKDGVFDHTVLEIGDPSMSYVTRYRLDLSLKAAAAEIRIHAGKDGKYNIPDEYRADVSYGTAIKAIAAFLYSEGVVSNDRIAIFLNSLSGDTLDIATGSIYHFCRKFSEGCAAVHPQIEETDECRKDLYRCSRNQTERKTGIYPEFQHRGLCALLQIGKDKYRNAGKVPYFSDIYRDTDPRS